MKGINRKQINAALLALVACVAVAGVAYASGGEGQGAAGGSLSPEKLKDLLWRTMNFAGLVAILLFTLKKPIANGLNSRRQAIAEQFDELDARKVEAERKYKEYEAKLGQIDGEMKRILDAAVAQGEVEKERIITEANRVAADIKRQAAMAIQFELSQAKSTLKNEIAGQALAIAEELLRKNLQTEDQSRLIKDCLSKVGGSK